VSRTQGEHFLEEPSIRQLTPVRDETQADAPAWGLPATVVAVGLVLLVLIAFSPCLQNDFVNWDDDKNILENASYRGLGLTHLRWDWTSFHVGVYQPLAWMILGAEYLLFGLKPWGYHLASLVLYAVNTILLFVLTLTLLGHRRPGSKREAPWMLALGAGLAVALFTVHPLRTEVVAWASGQPYLPCAFFLMLTVLAYLRAFERGRAPRWEWLAGSFFLFAGALLSKAVAVTLPAVLLILDGYPLGRLGRGRGRWCGPQVRRVWWEKVPFTLLSTIFVLLAIAGRVESEPQRSAEQVGIGPRISQACYGIGFYMVKTVLPANLTAFYPMPQRMVWFKGPFLWSILATLGLTVLVFLLRRRWPALLAVWLSYVLILLPNLGLVGTSSQIGADRYSYIAMMGGVVLLAAGFCQLSHARHRARWNAVGLVTLSLAAVAGLVILTQRQCRTWRTSESLWTHVLTHGGSRSPTAHNSLGTFFHTRGRLTEAAARYEEALRLNPRAASAHNNLGAVLYAQGHMSEARAHYEEALRLNPREADAHNNLGAVLYVQGRRSEATAHFEEALRLNPNLSKPHRNLGLVLLRQGRVEEARAHFEAALRLNPNFAEVNDNAPGP
jgi:Tfp pilus assembly protein PilF